MNGHEQYAALLDAYIDGALSEQDAARVREHLTQCPECQSYVSDALAMRELFPGLEETEVPEGFAESVMSALPAQKIIWRRQWTKIAAPLAACVAVALLIGGLSGLRMGGAASMDSSGATPETAEFDGAAYPETPLESAEAPEAELYSVTTADWDDEATEDADEYQAAIVTSDMASQSAFDGGGTSWSASERVAAAESATAGSGVSAAGSGAAASRNGAALKSAPNSGGAATKSASDSGASASGGDALTEYALNGGASASDSYAATESASESGAASNGYGVAQSALDGGAVSDSATARNASAFDDTNAPTLGATSDDADTMPPQTTESAPVPEPSDFPQDNATLTSAAPSDAFTEESVTDDMAVTEAFPLSVSVWTLAPDAAPVIMERYPPDAVTDSGIWYTLTAAEFDELCERFPDIEITSGPETMDADDLPDGAPAPVDSDAIYIFAPTG